MLRTFDYLPPANVDAEAILPGCRVRVPFGRRQVVGLVLAQAADTEVAVDRLRHIVSVLDSQPVVPKDVVALALWAIHYYHHPPGDVCAAVLPTLLRGGASARRRERRHYRATQQGHEGLRQELFKRAPKQRALLARLVGTPDTVDEGTLDQELTRWKPAAKALMDKGMVERVYDFARSAQDAIPRERGPLRNPQQVAAIDRVRTLMGDFRVALLEGVTGSGKTEVYMGAIDEALERNRQALVLVPEIGLTPQLLDRFQRRFRQPLAVLHSGLSDRQRLDAWAAAREGDAPIVIGTRSAVFAPLARPGLIVIDEEHDSSFKQQDGFRYSARDLAIVRARLLNIPALLGSATPSMESLWNARRGRYVHLRLENRAGAAKRPVLELLDIRGQRLDEGLSASMIARIRKHLARDEQVLVFLNRRGFAPTLLCHECGWVGRCGRCDAHQTMHSGSQRLICHHCGSEKPLPQACPSCSAVDLRPIGQGTQRIEQALSRHFRGYPVARIDRDAVRRKGGLENLFAGIRSGHFRLLVGTQILAKGHDFPLVTLVVVVDADQGLFSADFRAGERLAQLLLQVAGRAGRAERAGHVLIQTHHPDHPLLDKLVRDGYPGFAEATLSEREQAALPPFTHQALLRAEATSQAPPSLFLREAVRAAGEPSGVELLGPVPSPMERRAGRWRAQVLIQAPTRRPLHEFLDRWIPELESMSSGRRVRWSVDVDPADLF